MSLQPKMTIKNDEFSKSMKELVKKFQDLRPLFVVVKVIIDRSIMKNFRAQGRPVKWANLAPLTADNRRAERTMKGNPILQRYGTLRQSLGTEVLEMTKTSLSYGTKQVKAAQLQFGGTILPKKGKYLAIPVRGTTGSPRDYKNTFIPRGKKVIMQSVKGEDPKLLFILKDSVTTPPRPFLMFQEEDIEAIVETAWSFAFGDKNGMNYSNLLKGMN